MVVDWDEASAYLGQMVQVKIEMLDASGSTLIPTIVCSCTTDVFRLGEEPEEIINGVMYPYVLYNTEGWSSGIAVSNVATDVSIGDMEAVFLFVDSSGSVFTYTKTNFTTQVYATTMESLIEEAKWEDVASGAGFLKITTNFTTDGYQFNFYSDGIKMFGASVLPRLLN